MTEKTKTGKTFPGLAVVAEGDRGRSLVQNFFQLGVLSAICDRPQENLISLSSEFPEVNILSFSEILGRKEIPAVAIATAPETHADFVRQSLLAGKDVFVEEPLGLSVQDGLELVKLAKARDRILMVGHLLWYHPGVLKLKALMDAGELGRIQYIYSNSVNIGEIHPKEENFSSFSPHDISVILGLLDEMPDKVTAQGGMNLRPDIPDVTFSLLSFPSGVKAHVFVSRLPPLKEQKLIVVGDRKTAVFDDLEKEAKLCIYPKIDEERSPTASNPIKPGIIALEADEPLRAACLHFLESLEKHQVPRTDGAEGLRVLKVLQACQKSLLAENHGRTETPFSDPPPYFSHETAFIDEHTDIGEGTKIWHVSHILEGSRIGKHCQIGQNCVVGPDVTLGDGVKVQNNVSIYKGVTLEDNVFCGPSMVFTNVYNPRCEIPRMDELKLTLVKQGATLGANCTIVCGVTIGAYAFIGAGAVVVKDVPDFALMVGNPARQSGWFCRCGVKLLFENKMMSCESCHTQYSNLGHCIEISEEPEGVSE